MVRLGRLARERRDKIVQIFQEVGAQEFTFIERSGFYFGFLFGVVQVAPVTPSYGSARPGQPLRKACGHQHAMRPRPPTRPSSPEA